MKKELLIEKKEFTPDNGNKIEYYSFILEVKGKKFSLIARAEDKKLLNYLLDEEENA